jgi:nitroreductase
MAIAAPLFAADKSADNPALLDAFTKRQTVRKYKSDPVPDERLTKILDAARRAPTCANQQPWKFLVVRDKAKIQQMKEKTLAGINQHFDKQIAEAKDGEKAEIEKRRAVQLRFSSGYFTAPVYVVVLVDKESSCSGYAIAHDGPMAAGYMMVAARAFGYGTAYLTDGISEAVVRDVLKIPARYHRTCTTPIGVPDGWPEQVEKRPLKDIVAYETLEGTAPLNKIPYHPIK